jgi:hypothetical protein
MHTDPLPPGEEARRLMVRFTSTGSESQHGGPAASPTVADDRDGPAA